MSEGNTTNETATRMSGDERHSQLLQIAIGLFSEKGFNGATTREIANRAGISEAMVFRHFANKEELYSAILDHKANKDPTSPPPWEDESYRQALQEKDDYEVFYRLALNALEKHKKDEEFLRLLLHSALEGHELSQMFFEKFVLRLYELLSEYIRQRQEDGAMRAVEPRVVVRAYLGMLIHHSLNNLLWDREGRLLKISTESAAHEFTMILLNGIKTGSAT